MNELERNMVNVLKELKDSYGVDGVKAEFEAEGTRLGEALRLKEIVTAAGLDLTIKIGGGEAIFDMRWCKTIGVARIVAPMIESAYALKKYVQAIKDVCQEDEREDVQIAINVETITSYKNFDSMLALPEAKVLNGIVLGRVDLVGSMGLSREVINSSSEVIEIARTLFTKAHKQGLETALGGGVSADTIGFIHNVGKGLVDRYETRKVIFGCPGGIPPKNAAKGILAANRFELLWLHNKENYYTMIATEDAARLTMLRARYDRLVEDAGTC